MNLDKDLNKMNQVDALKHIEQKIKEIKQTLGKRGNRMDDIFVNGIIDNVFSVKDDKELHQKYTTINDPVLKQKINYFILHKYLENKTNFDSSNIENFRSLIDALFLQPQYVNPEPLEHEVTNNTLITRAQIENLRKKP